MKKIFSLLVFASSIAMFSHAAEPSQPVDAYTQAVTAYVEAANREMIALHNQVDLSLKTADGADKAKYEAINRQLDECDRLLGRLTSAGQRNFDKVKSAYERERGGVFKAIEELKKS